MSQNLVKLITLKLLLHYLIFMWIGVFRYAQVVTKKCNYIREKVLSLFTVKGLFIYAAHLTPSLSVYDEVVEVAEYE